MTHRVCAPVVTVNVRGATREDGAQVGRTLAEGCGDDPVMTWVFGEPRRCGTLSMFSAFLARRKDTATRPR